MKLKNTAEKFTIVWFTILALQLLFIIGYIQCIIHFVNCDFQQPFKAEVIYGIGIFTGLGGILGWFNFGK